MLNQMPKSNFIWSFGAAQSIIIIETEYHLCLIKDGRWTRAVNIPARSFRGRCWDAREARLYVHRSASCFLFTFVEHFLRARRNCTWKQRPRAARVSVLDRPSQCLSETRYRRADGRCWSVFKLQEGRHCQSEVRQLMASCCCCFGLKFHMWTNMHSLIILKIFYMHIDRADIHEICLWKLICRAHVISRLWFICKQVYTDLQFL